jgi:hypothetical protein
MSTPEDVLEIIKSTGLYGCNRTELFQMCQEAGLKPLPKHGINELMLMLVGEHQHNPDDFNDIDSWRHGLAGFVLDHWKVLQNQLKCPLKSQDPLSCFGCLDAQVICCITTNSNNLVQIRRYRK